MPVNPAQILIGCCLLDSTVADTAMASGVTAAAMPTAPLASLWQAIIQLRASGKAISTPAIGLSLGNSCPFTELFDCEAASPTTLHAEEAIKATLFQARTRAMLPLLGELKLAASAGNKEAIESIAPQLMEVLQPKVSEPGRSMEDSTAEAIRMAQAMASGETAKDALNWPLPSMNRFMYPIGRHELVMLGARPATGKTSLLLQLVGQALHDKRRVAHFTLETSDVQTIHQLCAQRAEVDLRNLALAPRDRLDRFTQAMQAVGTGKLFRIFDRDMAMPAIESRCRMLRESWQPDLVTIDYLTLIQGGHGKSLYEKVTDVANRLVELRKVLGCPVVVAAQLSRGVEGEDREPRCSDARDSGAIEQAAHRMVFIWRPRNDFTGSPQIGAEIGQRNLYDSYILQAKFRDGPICNVKAKFQSSLARFVEP